MNISPRIGSMNVTSFFKGSHSYLKRIYGFHVNINDNLSYMDRCSIKKEFVMKRSIIRILFFAETIGFLCVHVFGPQGIRVFQQLANENLVVEQSIERVRSEIVELDKRITACKSDAFYKERIAREQLQMARKDDVIYYFD